jgi:hypothetical protein
MERGGWESTNSNEGTTHCVVLFIYIYFLFRNQTDQEDDMEGLEREG